MKYLKRYWVMYTLLVVAIAAIIYFNWETIKGWFSRDTGTQVLDANGNPTGIIVSINSSARQRACCSSRGGFIGNCNYPIKPTDSIPACASV